MSLKEELNALFAKHGIAPTEMIAQIDKKSICLTLKLSSKSMEDYAEKLNQFCLLTIQNQDH